ncbi:MAG: helix-turn-helix domain-containing protein [Desulfovibrio sp.]|jgi:transcriptional regulator with XRE-family HTH domain|nr:helix-turn-helix domain-containing protein [Desulfovibrio sp.]
MPNSTITEILGKNIAERRRRLGLSQKELATKLGITQDAMARMEKGSMAPKMARLPCLAEALRCSVTHLFRRHDEDAEALAASIADILRTVPPEGREALLDLVAHAARVMGK